MYDFCVVVEFVDEVQVLVFQWLQCECVGIVLELYVCVFFEVGVCVECLCGVVVFGFVLYCKKLNVGEVQSLEWEEGFLLLYGGYCD